MILSEFVTIKTKYNNQIDHYKNLGYDVTFESITVPISILSTYSRCVVKARCHFCNKDVDVQYDKYNVSISNGGKFACSKKCAAKKRKDTNLKKYGVEFPIQSKDINDKIKNTNLKKYGYENASKCVIVIDKIKNTNLERYGVDNTFKSEDIKSKIKETNLKKYGVEFVSQSPDIRNKIKNTNLERYGVDNTFKSEGIKSKIKETNLKKYGVEFVSQSRDIKERIKESNLEKYGVANVFQSEDIKSKIKETNLEKYGVEFISQSINIKDKTRKTFINKYSGIGFESDTINEKIKKSNISRYGSEFISQNQDIKLKIKETNIKRYGTDNIEKSDNYRLRYNICNHPNYLKYLNNKTSIFKCDIGEDHNFEINKDNFYNRKNSNIPLCTICYPIGDSSSIKELELLYYISSIYKGEILPGYRDGLEIDIYLPDLKIGFEFNGLYWHSIEFKDKNYHIDKTKHFQEKGIRIIHVWEDDWSFKNEIIKSQIKNWIGLEENRIFARKCKVREIVDPRIVRNFLNNNHVQGYIPSTIKIGLFYNDQLVSLMTFDHFEGRKKMNDSEWNLSRFVNILNTNVVGSASKLLSFFIKNYNPSRIISFADKSWSVGSIYYRLGFNLKSETAPNYKYIVNNIRKNKQNYKKQNLVKIGCDESHSEVKIMKSLGFNRIYDCGQIKFEICNFNNKGFMKGFKK